MPASAKSDLPEGWVLSPMEDCTEILDHMRIPVNGEERRERHGPIPYYGATGQIGWIDDYLFDEELLLLGEDGAPFLDKSKPIAYVIKGKSWVNNHAHVLRAIQGLTSNRFLKFYLDVFDFGDFVTGTTRLKLNQGVMRTIPVVFPPIAEQERIVNKVERLLARVNAARERLARVPAILKRFRQSVLASACSGRLTADWRDGYCNLERAADTVERVLSKRRKKWEVTQTEKARTPGKISNRNRYKLKYKEPALPGLWDLPGLPDSWCWATIEQLASPEPRSIQSGPFGSNLLHSEFRDTGILAIGIDNVLDGEFSIGSQHRISKEKYRELSKYKAQPLDVLITVMATIGRCCVLPADVETAIITKHVYRITADRNLVDPYYLMLALRGDTEVWRQINSQIRGQTRPGINGQILKTLAIPTPPLYEQQEIVRRVSDLLNLADRIEVQVASATGHPDKLTQSILSKAFRGELVPTEAELARREGRDYEPASVLLERIKAEREAQEAKQGPKSRRASRKRLRKREDRTTKDESEHRVAISSVRQPTKPSPRANVQHSAQKSKPVSILELEPDEVMAAFRKACRGRGSLSREDLLREVAMVLGYQRTGSAVHERLKGHLRAAILRGIVEPNGDLVRPLTRTIDDYALDFLIDTVRSVMRSDQHYRREEAVRASAQHLGFSRINKQIDTTLRKAISTAIRRGDLVSDREEIWRI